VNFTDPTGLGEFCWKQRAPNTGTFDTDTNTITTTIGGILSEGCYTWPDAGAWGDSGSGGGEFTEEEEIVVTGLRRRGPYICPVSQLEFSLGLQAGIGGSANLRGPRVSAGLHGDYLSTRLRLDFLRGNFDTVITSGFGTSLSLGLGKS
jgi:hypothetical protein